MELAPSALPTVSAESSFAELGVLGAGVSPGYSANLAEGTHLLRDRKEDVSL